jgi:glycerol kinase
MASQSDVLVIDIGTRSLRAVIVRPDASLIHEVRAVIPLTSPFQGAVEFDAIDLADAAKSVASACLELNARIPAAVGIATQRASTIVWDKSSGQPVGPAIGWQDIRTAGMCLMHQPVLNLAPNQSATKLAFLLDVYDFDRARSRSGELLFGTVDTWIAWTLSHGSLHVTDASNAAVTGLTKFDPEHGVVWDERVLGTLNIPPCMLPTIVDSSGELGTLAALPGSPMLAGLVGDQQASLVGQSCIQPGQAKITFGTGGMLDTVLTSPPEHEARFPNGSFPIVAWRHRNHVVWGAEAIMLSAGTCVQWLRDDMGLIDTAAASETIAEQGNDRSDVWFVPALLGIGTPQWDYGARGALIGLTRGSGKADIVRAVLEGIAHRGADLVDAAVTDTGQLISALRIDGGMSDNRFFVQALANTTQMPIEVSPVREATALGAGYLAGIQCEVWGGFDDISQAWRPAAIIDPTHRLDRDRWRDAVRRSAGWLPDLSALRF